MQPEIKKYLFDIKGSIDSIYEFLGQNADFQFYDSNKIVRRAIERELEIIGEAMNRILKIDDTINIQDGRRIVNLRNFVIHTYDNVDNVIIWGILQKDIPALKLQVEDFLNS